MDSDAIIPTIPMEVPNPVTPTLAGQTIGNPSKLRSDDEEMVVQGGSMSLQPISQLMRSGWQM